MKLPDLIVNAQVVVRTITTFVRYPEEILSRLARQKFEEKIGEIDVPGTRQDRSPIPPAQRSHPSSKANLTVSPASQTTAATSTRRRQNRGPIKQLHLNEGDILVGRWGRYTIEAILDINLHPSNGKRLSANHKTPAWIRNIYSARSSKNSTVWIEEYRFPGFNDRQMQEFKQQVDRLEAVSLRSGGVQDFRLITPTDFFVDTATKIGYLICQDDPHNRIPLREYLEETNQPMTSLQVKRLLAQVLQSLLFLHQQPIRFGDGSTQQGVIHNNINLDNVWIEDAPSLGGQPQFKIYLKKTGLWWNPFETPNEKPKAGIKQLESADRSRDLKDLGQLAASLLIQETDLEECFQKVNGIEKKLAEYPAWKTHPDEPLKEFILDLTDYFKTAESAIRELRDIEDAPEVSAIAAPTAAPELQQQSWGCMPWVLLTLLGLGITGWWLFLRPNQNQQVSIPFVQKSTPPEPTRIQDLQSLKQLNQDRYQYTASSLWQDIIGLSRVSSSQNLQAEMAERDSSGKLQKFSFIKTADNNWQAQLKQGKIAFMLREWDPNLPAEFEQKVIAYDGIAVLVGSTDPNKLNANNQKTSNIPKQLGGSITFEELQKIFRGDFIVNDKSFQVFIPQERKVRKKFQTLVFGVEASTGLTSTKLSNTNKVLEEILQLTLQTNPNNEIAIGFERISKVLGQCSVYPLKIEKAKNQSAQPFIQDTGDELTPDIDLCHAKGSYWANEKAFRDAETGKSSYPLAYALSIVYLKNSTQFTENTKAAQAFYEVLTTDEGQCLLSEAGLVSISNVRTNKICKGGN